MIAGDWKDQLGTLLGSGALPEGEAIPEEESGAKPARDGKKEKISVAVERKGRGGKVATIAFGFKCGDEELAEIASRLKRRLGTGGSARGGEILIQGNLPDKLKQALADLGYQV